MQKKLTWSSLKSGLVFTIALIFLFAAVFFSGNIVSVFSPRITLVAKIDDIQGLRTGAPVWLHGVEIGTVESIKIIEHGTIISLSLFKRSKEFIHADAKARVMTMGLLGDKFIELTTGSTDQALISPMDTIYGKSVPEIGEIVESGVSSFDKVDTLVKIMRQFLLNISNGDGTLDKIINDPSLYNNFSAVASQLSESISDLQKSNGSFKSFLEKPELYNNLNQTIQGLDKTVSNVNQSVVMLQDIFSQIGRENYSDDGSHINDTTLIMEMKEAVSSLQDLIIDIKTNPKRYFQISVF